MKFNEVFAGKRSNEQAEEASRLIRKDPVLIEKLIKYLSSGSKEHNLQASHIFYKVTDLDISLLLPYQEQVLPLLEASVHISVKRCILRFYSQIKIEDDIAGKVVNVCFNILTDRIQPPAIKIYAMTTIASIAQKYQDLMQELRIILEEQIPYASTGFKNRAGKILSGEYKFNHYS